MKQMASAPYPLTLVREGIAMYWQGLKTMLVALHRSGFHPEMSWSQLQTRVSSIRLLCNWLPLADPAHNSVAMLSKACTALAARPDQAAQLKLLSWIFRQDELFGSGLVNQLASWLREQVLALPESEFLAASQQAGPQLIRLVALQDFLQQTGPGVPGSAACRHHEYQQGWRKLLYLRCHWLLIEAGSQQGSPTCVWQQKLAYLRQTLQETSWHLESYCLSLAAAVRDLLVLADCSGQEQRAGNCRDLARVVLALHVRGLQPDFTLCRALQEALFQLSWYGYCEISAELLRELPDNSARPVHAELLQALLRDRSNCGALIQALLTAQEDKTLARQHMQRLLAALGNMQWSFQDCGLAVAAFCVGTLFQILSRYWFCKLCIPAEMEPTLRQLSTLLQFPDVYAVAALQWEAIQTNVLQHWPAGSYDNSLTVCMEDNEPVALDLVPDLLAGAFDSLITLQRDMFAGSVESFPHFRNMIRELSVLERGAAAVGIRPLEDISAHLLELHTVLAQAEPEIELPTSLLQQAHEKLLDMLDTAAAWQEVKDAEATVGAIKSWLDLYRQQQMAGLSASAENTSLGMELDRYVSTLSTLLEVPIRFDLGFSPCQTGAVLPPCVSTAAQVLLRFLILDIGSNVPERRRRHLPAVTRVQADIYFTEATCRISIKDDSGQAVPGPQNLQALCRRLPASVTGFSCQEQGVLRIFQLQLPAELTAEQAESVST